MRNEECNHLVVAVFFYGSELNKLSILKKKHIINSFIICNGFGASLNKNDAV